MLALSTCDGADRSGKVYPDGLDPDVIIAEPETRPALEALDAAIRTAQDWLAQQTDVSR